MSCFFSLLVFSLLFSSLLFHLLLSFLVSPLSSSRFFSFLVSSSLFLSCLVSLSHSVSVCLSLSVSVSLRLSPSLSPCGVVCCGIVWCVSLWSWCCCWSWCVFGVCVCVCCGTLKKREKKKKRVWIRKRLRVCIQNVPVYAGTTRTCVSTRARGAGTHGDVLNLHTEGVLYIHRVIVSSAYQNLPTYGYHVTRRFTKSNHWILPIFKFENRLRTTCPRFLQSFALPNRLFSFSNPEGHCGRNKL